MAGSINKHTIIGSLGADPEKKTFNDGNSIVNMRVATSESWTDRQSGEKREVTQWHSVVIKNDGLAKVAAQYLKKGSRVYLEGRIEHREYEKDGVKRYITETVVPAFNGVLVLLGDPKGNGGAPAGNKSTAQNGGRANASAHSEYDSGGLNDEIPF